VPYVYIYNSHKNVSPLNLLIFKQINNEGEKKNEHKYNLAYYFTAAAQTSDVSCDDSVVLGSLQAVLVKPLTYVCYRLMMIPVSIHKIINISELLKVQSFPS
jgi:hypothetical protein